MSDSEQKKIEEVKQETVELTAQEVKQVEEIEIEEAKIPEGILAAIANKYDKGKREAILAAARRVSKRMLLSARAKKMTLVCPVTGIVSLLDIPVIQGCYLQYEHPLSSVANARALAQKGPDYLKFLDTRTLAGILLVLSDAYDLFKFLPSSSGAEKNAILRTAGKETIIHAIVLIEGHIHSRNRQHVPVLSLLPDTVHQGNSCANIRLHNWLSLTTESLRKPDTSVYDENAKPKKVGRPVYIRDVLKQEKKLSYMARMELSAAKKELAADAKEAKKLASNIVALGLIKEGFKPFMANLMSNDGLAITSIPQESIDRLISKLSAIEPMHKDTIRIIEILRKDRKILKMEILELDDLDTPVEQDDPKPGQETAEEEPSILEEIVEEVEEEIELEAAGYSEEEVIEEPAIEEPPAGLSGLQLILWKKQHAVKQERYKQPVAPEVKHVYIPKDAVKPVEEKQWHFAGYSPDRLFLVYSTKELHAGVYYVHDDYGMAIFAKTTLPYGFRDI